MGMKATSFSKKVTKRDGSSVEFDKGKIKRAIEGAAFDVTPRQHLLLQAAFQKHCDNSVSKTINLPNDATAEDVRKIYLMAHSLRCKGITIYRYGSKEDQVLSFDDREGTQPVPQGELITVDSDYSGGCVTGTCPF
jgi:ribonucleoside-diphosphate reductase alpha chain